MLVSAAHYFDRNHRLWAGIMPVHTPSVTTTSRHMIVANFESAPQIDHPLPTVFCRTRLFD